VGFSLGGQYHMLADTTHAQAAAAGHRAGAPHLESRPGTSFAPDTATGPPSCCPPRDLVPAPYFWTILPRAGQAQKQGQHGEFRGQGGRGQGYHRMEA